MHNNGSIPLAFLALFALSFLLAGCASVPTALQYDNENRAKLTDDFKNGEARLDCWINCVAVFAYNRSTLRRFYDTELWKDLAVNVLSIGYGADISYYYLGRAAEGLGYAPAADVYYRLSTVSEVKCIVVVKVCEGFVFPKDAEARLAIIRKQKEEKHSQPTPKTESTQRPAKDTGPIDY